MAKQGGKRKGAGRHLATSTLQAQEIRRVLVERVFKEVQPLLDAQIGLAKGLQMMMVRDWETKNGKQHRTGKWIQVTEQSEVIELLNGNQADDEYYQIWTKTPDNNAAKNLLDQSIGRATEKIEHTGHVSLKMD